MKKLLVGAMLAMFAVTSAYAASDTQTPQQRMKECAPLTKGMTKENRSAFMSKCLSKEGHEAAMAGKAATGGVAAKAGKKARKAHAKVDSAAAEAGATADQTATKAKKETRKAKKAAADAGTQADHATAKAKKKTRKAKKAAADAATAAGAAQ